MKIAPKILLVLFVMTLVLGLTRPGSEFLGGILKPLATVFFMLFFITMLFGPEIAKYDEEHRPHPKTRNSGSSVQGIGDSSEDSNRQPAFTSTHSNQTMPR